MMKDTIIKVEITDRGYATVDKYVDGETIRIGGYPYRMWDILIADLRGMLKHDEV